MGNATATHWIELDGAVNARAVVPGALLRSDNLQSLSARDVRRLLREERVELVLDLRTLVEVEREGPGPLTREPAVRIEHRSLYPESVVPSPPSEERITPWHIGHDGWLPDETPVVRAYLGYLHRRPDSVVAAIRAIARADGAVLVHCAAGKDRTGVIVAMALDAAGVERERIVSDYLASTQRIEAILARLISSPTYRAELEGHDPARHAPVPGTIERVLELLDERSGGATAWLLDRGLAAEDLGRLRQRLG